MRKARIAYGSGVLSGQIVTIVPHGCIKINGRGIPTNVEGAYQPVDWKREHAIRLSDGTYSTMFKNRLSPIE